MYRRVLTMQDISCVGQCSATVALPILSACGMEACILPTALLSTHTGGFGTPARLDGSAYGEQALEHYHALGVEFDCIYTGYLGGETAADADSSEADETESSSASDAQDSSSADSAE